LPNTFSRQLSGGCEATFVPGEVSPHFFLLTYGGKGWLRPSIYSGLRDIFLSRKCTRLMYIHFQHLKRLQHCTLTVSVIVTSDYCNSTSDFYSLIINFFIQPYPQLLNHHHIHPLCPHNLDP
jgi:hypothetical protein